MATEDSETMSPRQKAAAERAFQQNRPDDNPFMEVVDDLRDDGLSFEEIHYIIDEAYDAVSEGWSEEMSFLVPEWRVTALVPDDTPSGVRHERYTRCAGSQHEAEEMVVKHTGHEVDSAQTEQVGYAKVS